MLNFNWLVEIYNKIKKQRISILSVSILIPHALVFLTLFPLTSEWSQELFHAAKAAWIPSHLVALSVVILTNQLPWRAYLSGLGVWFISGPAVVPSLAFCYTHVFNEFREPSGLHFVMLSLTELLVSTLFVFILIQTLIIVQKRIKYK